MSAVHYDSYTEARAHLKDLLDAAEKGRVATVRRDSATTAVVDVERLRHILRDQLQADDAVFWSCVQDGSSRTAGRPRRRRRLCPSSSSTC
jgi:hypothetical protein